MRLLSLGLVIGVGLILLLYAWADFILLQRHLSGHFTSHCEAYDVSAMLDINLYASLLEVIFCVLLPPPHRHSCGSAFAGGCQRIAVQKPVLGDFRHISLPRIAVGTVLCREQGLRYPSVIFHSFSPQSYSKKTTVAVGAMVTPAYRLRKARRSPKSSAYQSKILLTSARVGRIRL